MEQQFNMVAKTFKGLEGVLAAELTELGADNIQTGNRMVSFTGDKAMLYRANFALRTAVRVLKPIKEFKAQTADEVYEAVKSVEWEQYIGEGRTFAVDSVVFSEVFRHSMFVSYRVKDAIADYFREKTGRRPSVSVKNPDVLLNIHVSDTDCILSLDSSGESLHRRGYRMGTVEAPLNEVLAAGLILLSGWHGECDLIDPMCGSGTIPIEAALIARNIAPGVFRQDYAFEKWPDFDRSLFESIYNDDSQERDFTHKIYAYDKDPKAVGTARANIKSSGTARDIEIDMRPLKDFVQPTEPAVMITNPPYGERISTDNLLELYHTLGERLKHAFTGNKAWVLSMRDECFDEIGLKPTVKIDVFNGELECQFREYEIFDGKYREFREEGDALDKESARRRVMPARGERNDRGERSDRRRPRPHREEGRDDRRSHGEHRSFGGRRESGERRDFGKRRESGDRRGGYGEHRGHNERRSFGGKREFGERRFESYPERKRREQAERMKNRNTETNNGNNENED